MHAILSRRNKTLSYFIFGLQVSQFISAREYASSMKRMLKNAIIKRTTLKCSLKCYIRLHFRKFMLSDLQTILFFMIKLWIQLHCTKVFKVCVQLHFDLFLRQFNFRAEVKLWKFSGCSYTGKTFWWDMKIVVRKPLKFMLRLNAWLFHENLSLIYLQFAKGLIKV